MIDEIICIQCDLAPVPWETGPAGVPRVYSSTPGRYHVPYGRNGAAQVGWHGETYCLVGGYRCFGDAPLPTPAKVEAKKPGPRQAPKSPHPRDKSVVDLGCSSPQIRRPEPGDKKLSPQKLIPVTLVTKKPGPSRARKRRHPGEESEEDPGCSRPKIRRLEPGGKGLSPQKLIPVTLVTKKPGPSRARKRRHPGEESEEDPGCSRPKIRRLEPGGKGLSPQKLIPVTLVTKKPGPSRARKRRHPGEESEEDPGCSRPKIRRLEPGGKGLSPQKLAG